MVVVVATGATGATAGAALTAGVLLGAGAGAGAGAWAAAGDDNKAKGAARTATLTRAESNFFMVNSKILAIKNKERNYTDLPRALDEHRAVSGTFCKAFVLFQRG